MGLRFRIVLFLSHLRDTEQLVISKYLGMEFQDLLQDLLVTVRLPPLRLRGGSTAKNNQGCSSYIREECLSVQVTYKTQVGKVGIGEGQKENIDKKKAEETIRAAE